MDIYEEIVDQKAVNVLIIGQNIDVVVLIILDLKMKFKIGRIGICGTFDNDDILYKNISKNLGLIHWPSYENAIYCFGNGICIVEDSFEIGMYAIENNMNVLFVDPNFTLEEHTTIDIESQKKGILVCINNGVHIPHIKDKMKYILCQSKTKFDFLDLNYFIDDIIRPVLVTCTSDVLDIIWENLTTKEILLSTHLSSNLSKISYTFMGETREIPLEYDDDLLTPDTHGNFVGQSGSTYKNISEIIESVRDIECGMAIKDSFVDYLSTIKNTYIKTSVLEASKLSLSKNGEQIRIEY